MVKHQKHKRAKRRTVYRFYGSFTPPEEQLGFYGVGSLSDSAFLVTAWRLAGGSKKERAMARAYWKRKRREELKVNPRHPQWPSIRGRLASEIIYGVRDLVKAVRSGDKKAAEAVAAVALEATRCLGDADPELLRSMARRESEWPILLTTEDNTSRVTQYILSIELARDTIEGQFRRTHGQGGAPRSWARRIAITLDHNRLVMGLFEPEDVPDLQMILRNKMGANEFVVKAPPAWALECIKLAPFDTGSFSHWWKLGKAMLRDQYPNFHEHPDWKQYSARWCCLKTGETQNRILDLIESALRGLAPRTWVDVMKNFASKNSGAVIR